MSEIAIRAEGLSKQYHLGAVQNGRTRTLGEVARGAAGGIARRAGEIFVGRHRFAGENEKFWALKDVSFTVERGEVVGVVGRNGAGKSTLLKVLSRITYPSAGFAEVNGRVGSLLEVGTGFHPELTGRENVFLNGAILGMRRSEIRRKFDEIVAFAEIESFVDTAVKHYSSGMYVRLAFAVAAHLEPEILIVDEVLAVGDIAFQRKCLGKMGSVANEGRAVLFVSHNMGAIDNLCTRGILLEDGQLVQDGPAGDVVRSYLRGMSGTEDLKGRLDRREHLQDARITNARLLDEEGRPCEAFPMGETIIVEFDAEFERPFGSVDASIWIKRLEWGLNVLHMTNTDSGLLIEQASPGSRCFRIRIPNCTLYPGSYHVSLFLGTDDGRNRLDYLENVLSFSMVQSAVSKRTKALANARHNDAVFFIPTAWQVS